MRRHRKVVGAIAALVVIGDVVAAKVAAYDAFGSPAPVAIVGLPIGAGGTPISTEEPYPSRDGRFLFFNSGEAEGNKDLHYAERVDGEWRYRGEIGPAINTPKDVQGNPTMDRAGRFYFIDSTVPQMIRAGVFERGQLRDVAPVTGAPERDVELFRQRVSGNMGVEVSADGNTLYFDRATWKLLGIVPSRIVACDILFMTRHADRFELDEPQARRIMANANSPDIDYAESVSADELEIFFTRLSPADLASGRVHSRIMRSARRAIAEPFAKPELVRPIGDRDFVEAPALTDDGRTLYYHKRVGAKFALYKVER
jgi:hypothetical protein